MFNRETEKKDILIILCQKRPNVDSLNIKSVLYKTEENLSKRFTEANRYYTLSDDKVMPEAYMQYVVVLHKEFGKKNYMYRQHFGVSAAAYSRLFLKGIVDSMIFKISEDGKLVELGNADFDVKNLTDEGELKILKGSTEEKEEVVEHKTDFYISDPVNEIYFFVDVMRKKSKGEATPKVMMVGPSGYGKTSIPRWYAEKAGLDYFRMNCATVRDPEEWFGQRTAKDGSIMFVKSPFIKAVEKGNCVIVLDEINRIETWLTNTIYPLLDDDKKTSFYDGVEVSVGKNVVFVGTMNFGHNYSGTFSLDAALANRFDFVCEVGNIPFEQEKEILLTRYPKLTAKESLEIVRTATEVRKLNGVECSLRTTLMISSAVALGMSVRSAFQNCVVSRCSNEIIKKQVIDVVNKLGIFTPNKKFFNS